MSTKTSVTPRSLRIPFVRRCVVVRENQEHTGLMIDLSVTGAYVQTETLPLEGEAVVLKFRVPGNDRLIEVPCVVAWVNPQQKHLVHSLPPGSGLHFRDVAQEDNILIVGTIRAYCQSNPIYRQYL